MAMQQRVMAARSFFWVVLTLNALAVFAAVPAPRDAQTTKALKELRAFRTRFDPRQKKQALIQEALRKANPTLDQIAERTRGAGVDNVIATKKRADLYSVLDFDLTRLYAVRELSSPKAELSVKGPEIKQIAESLRWRLARMGSSKGYRLLSLKCSKGGANKSDFELERQVEVSRQAALKARRSYLQEVNARDLRDRVLESRVKHRASRKRIRKARKELVETKQEVLKRRTTLDETRTAYQEVAERAEAFNFKSEAGSSNENPTFAVLSASIEKLPKGKPSEVSFPVAVVTRKIPVQPLAIGTFVALEAAGLWPATKFVSAEKAIKIAENNYSWHNKGLRVSTFIVGGPTVLYLLPLVLAFVMSVFTLRCKHSRAGYNPFKPEKGVIPKVGFGISYFDFGAIVALPLVATAFCGWSLYGINGNLVIYIIMGMAATGTSVWCYRELAILNTLSEDIQRTSMRPPAPK
ncbi:MAG: hypothetical protein JXA30_09405 [Deltaproteobacteria bacterium]|nr:hypothetical protein [Deltaproteobacteria bacterium]